MKVHRDVGGHGELGSRRYKRYLDAFDRVEHCVKNGYFLEAIAILDSLICDRLSSRLGYVTGEEIDSALTCGRLCKRLIDDGSEKDALFCATIRNIQRWTSKRNEALHATAKVFRSGSSPKDFTEILQSYKQSAENGIKYLQAFDQLDAADRAKAGKNSASYPDAFFPKRRKAIAGRL